MSDPRFARLKTDPRFRRIKKAQHKVVIDDRFKSVLDQGKKKDKGEFMFAISTTFCSTTS